MSKFKENVKDLFTNRNTIPNWLCFIRIALIPVFTVLFVKGQYLWAFIAMIVAALTDVFDGKIARKFNMVSNLGKILDPIADKLSQMAIVIILIVKFWQNDGIVKYIFFLFIFKELIMIVGGAILLSKGLRPTAAEIWGKVATVVFYVFMITIIAVGSPDGPLVNVWIFKQLPNTVTTIMLLFQPCLPLFRFSATLRDFLSKSRKTRQQAIQT